MTTRAGNVSTAEDMQLRGKSHHLRNSSEQRNEGEEDSDANGSSGGTSSSALGHQLGRPTIVSYRREKEETESYSAQQPKSEYFRQSENEAIDKKSSESQTRKTGGNQAESFPLAEKSDSTDASKNNKPIKKPIGDGVSERSTSTCSLTDMNIDIEPYAVQKPSWPREGKHILAQYNDTSIIVYQAFCPEIASYAVENQKLGGPRYCFDRMSWIKTSFLWMMFRSGWASKRGQERILAIRISRSGFDEILAKAYTAARQRQEGVDTKNIEVRLQWDPDHDPNGSSVRRRAIQLGLKKEILKRYALEFIEEIQDITDFVHAQHDVLLKESIVKLMIPKEIIYEVTDEDVIERIELDQLTEES